MATAALEKEACKVAVSAHLKPHTYGVVFRSEWGGKEVDLGRQSKVFGDVLDLESVSRLLCRLKHQEVRQKNYLRNVWCNGKCHVLLYAGAIKEPLRITTAQTTQIGVPLLWGA